MKKWISSSLVLLASLSSVAAFGVEGYEPYLKCSITSDGVNPQIPRTFEASVDLENKRWLLVFNIPGVPAEDMSQTAQGDIYKNKETGEIRMATFLFDDGTSLGIDFVTGQSRSDNLIFKHLEDAILKDCVLLD